MRRQIQRCVGFLFGFTGLLQAQELPILPEAYPINFNQPVNGQSKAMLAFATRALQARVILAGENHFYVKLNVQSEYHLLRLLHEKAGVRHYVIELSPTRALYMQRYFSTGDEVAHRYLKATSSQRYMNLFDSISGWNQTLALSERIHVWGLDVERFNDMTMMRLAEIVARKGVSPPALRPGFMALKALSEEILRYGLQEFDKDGDSSENEDIQENSESSHTETVHDSISMGNSSPTETVHDSVGNALPTKPQDSGNDKGNTRKIECADAFFQNDQFNTTQTSKDVFHWLTLNAVKIKAWLGDDTLEYSESMIQLKEWILWEALDQTAQQYNWREEHMFQNMVSLLNTYPTMRFFGQFGRCHVSYAKQQQDCGWFEYHSSVNRLRTRYFSNDSSLMSIGIFYCDPDNSIDGVNAVNLNDNTIIQNEVKALLQSTHTNSVLYNLESSESQLSELRKKFSFVLVNRVSEKSLVPKDWNTGFKARNYSSIGFGTLGRATMLSESLCMHFKDNGYALTNPKNFIHYGISLRSVQTFLSGRLSFSHTNQSIFRNKSEQIQYSQTLYNLDLGVHTASDMSWIVGFGGRVCFHKQSIRYIPPSLNFLNPQPSGSVAIQKRNWIPAAYVNLEKRFGNWISAECIVGYRKDFSSGKWYYKPSGLPYFNGKSIEGDLSEPFVELNFYINIGK